MENHNVVYRALARRFESADYDDIADALAFADAVAWEARESGTEVRNPEAFCTCVAKRALNRSVQRKKRLVYPDHEGISSDWDDIHISTGIIDEQTDPSDRIDANSMIDRAPENYAEVLRIHYLEGLSFEDAAIRLGVSPECLRKRHERALKWARKFYVER